MLELSDRFQIFMVIPVVVRYDLESVASLYSLPECCTFMLNMLIFNFFDNKFDMEINYPIELIFGILIPRTTKHNVISEASL